MACNSADSLGGCRKLYVQRWWDDPDFHENSRATAWPV